MTAPTPSPNTEAAQEVTSCDVDTVTFCSSPACEGQRAGRNGHLLRVVALETAPRCVWLPLTGQGDPTPPPAHAHVSPRSGVLTRVVRFNHAKRLKRLLPHFLPSFIRSCFISE